MTLAERAPDASNRQEQDFPVASIRAEFPALATTNAGKPLVYLDSAASALKPRSVIDAIATFYATDYANVHRSAHSLGEKATARYEGARSFVQQTIGANSRNEIVFTRNATEAINLVAHSWGSMLAKQRVSGSATTPAATPAATFAIAVSAMEHHSNLVPWQMLAERYGFALVKIPITEQGEIDLIAYRRILEENNVAMVAVAHISNVLGTVNPLADLITLAHAHGSLVLVDGSQGVPHESVDVTGLDADFYAFTGHKVYGPSGIGVLYGKESLLDSMPPYQGGGEMVERVAFESSSWNELPWKFEAGTPPIAQAVGLEAGLRFMAEVGIEAIAAYEAQLCAFMLERLRAVEGLRLLGSAQRRAPIFSFVLDGHNSFDVATLLDKQGFCCRAGLHCAEPLIRGYGLPGCVRATFAVYNNESEGEALIEGLEKARKMLG